MEWSCALDGCKTWRSNFQPTFDSLEDSDGILLHLKFTIISVLFFMDRYAGEAFLLF